jgi:putative peptidoglycan lipid II flippase
MPTRRQIFQSSLVVGFFSLLGGLTGILVDTSIAAQLGLSRSSDTFYVAITVPYIITNLISATGQFSLVPFFAALEARHAAEELWRGFSYAVSVIFLGLGGIALVGATATPWLVRGIAPGLTTPQIEFASQLGRWLFIIIVPAGVSEVFRSFLLSQRRFAFPSAAGFIRNLAVIASIILTFPRYREYSIVLGYFAGYLLQFVLLGGQILLSFPVRYSLTLKGSGAAFQNLRGAGTVQITTAMAWQGVVVVERIIASFLSPGTLTALNWGFKIMSTLAELLAGSVGTAALPALAKAFARQAKTEERKIFQETLKISLALVCPAMVFCLLLDRHIIRLVFERGSFTPEATSLMALVFGYYSLSLLLYSFVRVLTFYLFARHDAAVSLRLTIFQYALNVGFDLLYVGVLRLGAVSIPLGLFTSLILTCGLAFHRDLAKIKSSFDRAFGVFAAKNLVGAGLAVLSLWGLRLWMQTAATGLDNFLYLCVVCSIGLLVFVATLVGLGAVPIARLAALWRRTQD